MYIPITRWYIFGLNLHLVFCPYSSRATLYPHRPVPNTRHNTGIQDSRHLSSISHISLGRAHIRAHEIHGLTNVCSVCERLRHDPNFWSIFSKFFFWGKSRCNSASRPRLAYNIRLVKDRELSIPSHRLLLGDGDVRSLEI